MHGLITEIEYWFGCNRTIDTFYVCTEDVFALKGISIANLKFNNYIPQLELSVFL